MELGYTKQPFLYCIDTLMMLIRTTHSFLGFIRMLMKFSSFAYFASQERREITSTIPPEHLKQPDDKIFKVYTERNEISEFLTHPRFVIHDEAETADILWPISHIKDFK